MKLLRPKLALNAVRKKNGYPLPRLNENLDQIAEARVFSKDRSQVWIVLFSPFLIGYLYSMFLETTARIAKGINYVIENLDSPCLKVLFHVVDRNEEVWNCYTGKAWEDG